MKKVISSVCFLMFFVSYAAFEARAQFENVPFTYQGSLKDGGAAANGNYQMVFEFFTVPTGGTPFLSVSNASIPVTNGIFSVTFTGGTNQFVPGGTVWIETSVRRAGSADPFTPLAPRQRVTYSPLAISSLLAGDSQRLGGVEANQYLTTSSGATAFIQNGTTPQTGGFNLNGTGTANILNAATQFNLNGSRILSAGGADNLFAGFQAGQANTSGGNNSFFGVLAGGSNLTGNFNSFFGRGAGGANTGGNANSFVGAGAGGNNGTGERNTFFGFNAGSANSNGSFNTVVGSEANFAAGNLTNATALGYRAFAAQSNSLVLGSINGVNGASADTNVGIGTTTPTQRLQVVGSGVFSGNLGIGTTNPVQKLQITDNGANIVLGGLGCGTGFVGINFFGAAQSNNCINYSMLGEGASTYINRPAGGLILFRMANNDQMVLSASGNLGIGTNSPAARLSVLGGGFGQNLLVSDSNATATTFDLGNTSVGGRTWRFQSMGSGDGTRVGGLELWNVGGNFVFAVKPNGNVGFGTSQPESRVHVAGGLTVNGGMNYFAAAGNANFFMKGAGAANGINFGVMGNAGTNSTLYISQYDGTTYQDRLILDNTGNITIPAKLTVGIPNLPNIPRVLDVYGGSFFDIGPAATGTDFTVCGKLDAGSTIHSILVKCGISSIRYKNNANDLPPALELLRRLRPVSFNWKADNSPDVGFIAEEVADVEPQLVIYNPDKTVEGVRYEKLGIYLVKATQEQQTQIETQQKQIDSQAEIIRQQQEKVDKQQSEIEALKAIVCAGNTRATICQEKKP